MGPWLFWFPILRAWCFCAHRSNRHTQYHQSEAACLFGHSGLGLGNSSEAQLGSSGLSVQFGGESTSVSDYVRVLV